MKMESSSSYKEVAMNRLMLFLLLLFNPIIVMAGPHTREIQNTLHTLFAVSGFLLGMVVVGVAMVSIGVGIMLLFEKLFILVVGKENKKYFTIANIILTLLALLFGHAVSTKKCRKRG